MLLPVTLGSVRLHDLPIQSLRQELLFKAKDQPLHLESEFRVLLPLRVSRERAIPLSCSAQRLSVQRRGCFLEGQHLRHLDDSVLAENRLMFWLFYSTLKVPSWCLVACVARAKALGFSSSRGYFQVRDSAIVSIIFHLDFFWWFRTGSVTGSRNV